MRRDWLAVICRLNYDAKKVAKHRLAARWFARRQMTDRYKQTGYNRLGVRRADENVKKIRRVPA